MSWFKILKVGSKLQVLIEITRLSDDDVVSVSVASIEQAAQAVPQNSATVREHSVSEGKSSQTAALDELLDLFKSKDDKLRRGSNSNV